MRTKRISPRLVEVDFDEWLKDPEFRALVEKARVTGQIAQLVYDERHAAELTQRQLARRVGTTQSVIARLEDDNYEGHSLSLLRRIAAAVGRDLEVFFEPRVADPARKGRTRDSASIPGAMFGDGSLCARIDDEVGNAEVANLVRGARTRAKLTQQRLANLAKTTQPVIARLENHAYRGHSLGMLQRIAAALDCDLVLRFAQRWERERAAKRAARSRRNYAGRVRTRVSTRT